MIEAQESREEMQQFTLTQCIPGDLYKSMIHLKFFDQYVLNANLNPFYLRGDFNGDNELDYVIAIKEKVHQVAGFAIFTALSEYQIIGAGQSLYNNPIKDFSFVNAWHVYDKSEVSLGNGETNEISLIANAIKIYNGEVTSALIYWDGQKFLWYQQGD